MENRCLGTEEKLMCDSVD